MSHGIDRAMVDLLEGGVIVRIRVREIQYAFDEEDDVGALGDLFRIWTDRADVRWMIIDLSRVEAAASPFYGTLYEVHKRMRGRGAVLRLCGLTPGVLHVLELTKLVERFRIDRDVRAALDAIEASGGLPMSQSRPPADQSNRARE